MNPIKPIIACAVAVVLLIGFATGVVINRALDERDEARGRVETLTREVRTSRNQLNATIRNAQVLARQLERAGIKPAAPVPSSTTTRSAPPPTVVVVPPAPTTRNTTTTTTKRPPPATTAPKPKPDPPKPPPEPPTPDCDVDLLGICVRTVPEGNRTP